MKGLRQAFDDHGASPSPAPTPSNADSSSPGEDTPAPRTPRPPSPVSAPSAVIADRGPKHRTTVKLTIEQKRMLSELRSKHRTTVTGLLDTVEQASDILSADEVTSMLEVVGDREAVSFVSLSDAEVNRLNAFGIGWRTNRSETMAVILHLYASRASNTI